MNISALHLTDGYKVDHRRQYPENTVKVYSNFTPRKSRIDGIDSIVFFGLTYFIKDVMIEEFNRTFFNVDVEVAIKKYKRRLDNYLGKDNEITYEHIRALHEVGYLPVRIKALPEGALVKTNVPVLTITNEINEFFWVPNFLETILSCELWPGCTSLTTAFNYRLIFDDFAMKTVGNTEFSSTFQIHDFSMRGMYGRHAAFISGAAHLCASRGTDTIGAIDFLEEYYNADSDIELVGASVPATEHSVMCMGMQLGEVETMKRLINVIYKRGIVSIVADTWNLWDVVTPKNGHLVKLKTLILQRDGKVVIRPDSGDPVLILTGYKVDSGKDIWSGSEAAEVDGKYYRVLVTNDNREGWKLGSEISVEEIKGVVECLWEIFGGTISEKGFKVLDQHIGTIYGDSITLDRARQICQRLMDKGFASINWVAGVGSYTYQYVTRDTFGWAMKATYGEVEHLIVRLKVEEGNELVTGITEDGYEIEIPPYVMTAGKAAPGFHDLGPENGIEYVEPREIFKDPFTDRDPVTGLSVKKSAKGYLQVLGDDGSYTLRDQVTEEEEALGALELVYAEGVLVRDGVLSEIRARVDANVIRTLGLGA